MAYIVCKDEEEANKIANRLLDEKLIFCANMFPINSIFNWKGKKETEKEIVLIGKSVEGKWEEIKKEAIDKHVKKSVDPPTKSVTEKEEEKKGKEKENKAPEDGFHTGDTVEMKIDLEKLKKKKDQLGLFDD